MGAGGRVVQEWGREGKEEGRRGDECEIQRTGEGGSAGNGDRRA